MKIEIAICTWNRAQRLQKTLQRLSSIDVSDDVDVRVIVVDNNSDDGTKIVVEEFESSSLQLTYVFESNQGHSFARNQAVANATGDLLLWIDDDVVVGEQWLASYIQAAISRPEISFWGGPIKPTFYHRYPKWIDANWGKLKGCFACRDAGREVTELSKEFLPYGANFAIRTNVQKQFAFQTSLGRMSDSVSGEDELNLFRTMLDSGHKGMWVSASTVEHIIDSKRTNESYVQRYFVGQGRALASMDKGWSSDVNALFAESRHELICYRWKRYFTRSEVWLSHLIRGSLSLGQALELKARKNTQSFKRPS